MSKVYIIAEAGVNHNGSYDKAIGLIESAAKAGADAVKFQTFKTENVITLNAKKAKYQEKTTGTTETQFEMVKKLELPFEWHYDLIKHCSKNKIEFLSTAFDHDSLNFLVNNLGLNTLKIPSGEITNGPLLLAYAQTGCKLILSTGMSTIKEIQNALSIISFGYIYGKKPKIRPLIKNFDNAFLSEIAKSMLKEKITLLHCTTQYPAPFNDINLNAMITLSEVFDLPVGYSDHSEGIIVPISAASMGARIIEKHFTLDSNLPGPDHKASLEPLKLKEMVESIRIVEKILGDGIKVPRPSELSNRDVARKSIVAAKNIKKGDFFTEENLSIKRPGTGKNPMQYWDLIGKKSLNDYSFEDLID